MRIVTIRAALQAVADRPVLRTDKLLDVHTHELVARTLFEVANSADVNVRGSQSRANTARTMIFNRLVGRRHPGSHPATHRPVSLEFVDMTGGELDG
jgi:hypothetical protein